MYYKNIYLYKHILVLLTTIVLLFSCENNSNRQKLKPIKESLNIKLDTLSEIDTLTNDIASIISGEKPMFFYKNIANKDKWKKYSNNINKEWLDVEKSKIIPISKWMDVTLPNSFFKQEKDYTLFYPFAGADFLYAYAFFPKCKYYILIGLEPVGKINLLDTIVPDSLFAYMNHLKNIANLPNKVGFFRTEDMELEFDNSNLNGTSHLLLFYVKKLGFTINKIRYFNIDSTGKQLYYLDKESLKKEPIGFQIDFSNSEETQSQIIFYISLNINDYNLKKEKGYQYFINSFSNQITLFIT